MSENKNNEMVFELPSSQKKLFWILICMMAAIFAYLLFFSGIPSLHQVSFGIMAIISILVLVWLLIPSLSYRYVITDEKLVYSGKSLLLQDEEKEILLKDIAKAEHTQIFFKLYDKYDTVIFKGYVNNFITPMVYEEVNKRIDLSPENKHIVLSPLNKQEPKLNWKWAIIAFVTIMFLCNLPTILSNLPSKSRPTGATEQFQLGERYRIGEDMEKNYVQAVFWTRKAAEQGLAEAQNALGNYYRQGIGVEQSSDTAFYWYQQAAEQGYASAQCHLGQCYRYGRGVIPSIERAAYWYRQAALQGHADAQVYTGICYEYGYGVEKNYAEALSWYQKAQKDYKGNRDLDKYIRRCTKKMNKQNGRIGN